MKFSYSSAVLALIVVSISELVNADGVKVAPWMVRPKKSTLPPTSGTESTLLPVTESTLAPSAAPSAAQTTLLPISPSVAALDTTTYVVKDKETKETKETKLPTPSVAALEITTVLLVNTTVREAESTSTTKLVESSSLAPISQNLPSEVPLSPSSEIPIISSEAPIIPEASISPEAPIVSEAPISPSEVPISPSELPLTPSELPISPSEAPITPSKAPVEVETLAPTSIAPAPISESTLKEAIVTELPAETSSLAPGSEAPAKPEKPSKPEAPKPIPTLPPVDFDCSRKDDGYHADPKNKCSGTYYACVGGLARRLDCAGDLVYDPETQVCERRHESFRCTGTRKTTVPTTPRRPAKPLPTPVKLPIDCSNLDDGWYPDPSKKCSHVFYSCSNGMGSRFDCPGSMYYNIENKACEAFRDVVACAGKKRATTKRILTTIAPRVTEKIPIDCGDKPSGQYPDPSKKCSQVYYVCSNGDGIKRTCPDGLYYDAKKQLCDFYSEIFACVGRTKPATTPTTPAPKPSVASLLSTEFNCSSKKDGSYLLGDKKCSEIYFRCVGGAAYKLKCPDGLYYDLEMDVCERWINLFVCSGKKPTSPAPVTTVKPKPTEKLPIDCAKYSDGDFPDPEKKCSSIYYSCSGLGGTRRLCPDQTYFDKEMGICDIRANIPECSGKPRPKTTPMPTYRPRPVTKSPYNCEEKDDGNFPAGKCTDYYWSCVGGSTIRATCPRGTYFDTEKDECGFKHEIPACGGVRPTEKPEKPEKP